MTLSCVQKFLATCNYVSDQEQFGRKDYWQPPEEFERTKKGDCDCFALWTWRQLLALGYNARFVTGRCGRYGEGHAWVQFAENGKVFLVQPTVARVGNTIPRLSTLSYRPRFSVAWDGANISFYRHDERKGLPPFWKLLAQVLDWLIFWTWIWVMTLVHLPGFVYRKFQSRRS